MSVTEDIYYGDYKGYQLPITEQAEIDGDRKQLTERLEAFKKILPNECIRELNAIMNIISEIESKEKYYIYKNGVSFGISVIAEQQ